MKHQQFEIILRKTKEAHSDRVQTEFNGDRLVSLKTEFEKGVVQIRKKDGYFEIRFKYGTTSTNTELKYRWALFSPSHWRWRKMAKALEKKQTQDKKVRAKQYEEWRQQELNEAMLETFPELLEESLLGD